ncbi:chaperonin CPN60-2, mitochondrial, partial [Tanacetum coccineum]
VCAIKAPGFGENRNALKAPVHTIAANAGVEGAVVGKLLEQDNPDFGYYAAKGFFFSPSLLSLSPIHLYERQNILNG